MSQPLTISSLRARNRSAALSHLVTRGQATRAEIAAAVGLSPASATNIVADLMGEGLVVERGLLASKGGRPTALLEPAADGPCFVGADVGERGVAVELFDLTMTRLDREFRGGSSEESAQAIGRDLTEALRALEQRNLGRWSRVTGIGLGLPGIVETAADGEQTLYAESLGWPAVPVRSLLSHELPIFAQNGAKTLARAEQWFGAARGIDDAVVVLLGRGVGLGVISGGTLVGGHAGSALEWGHLCIDRHGPVCRCGRRGCVEALLGAQGILERWAAAGGRYDGSGWSAVGDLVLSAEAGDAAALSTVQAVIEDLGAALAGLVNLFNPRRLIVGGWVGLRLMESFRARIEDETRERSLARPGSQFDLHSCTFGGDTVALGAAIMPLESLIAEPVDAVVSRAARAGA